MQPDELQQNETLGVDIPTHRAVINEMSLDKAEQLVAELQARRQVLTNKLASIAEAQKQKADAKLLASLAKKKDKLDKHIEKIDKYLDEASKLLLDCRALCLQLEDA